MAQTILTIDMITREALMILHNTLVVAKNFNRQYDSSFAQSGAKIGSSLRIRLPNRFVVNTTNVGLNAQAVTEQYTTLTVDNQYHVDLAFSSADLTLSMDDFSTRILKPAMAQLASTIDYTCMGVYKEVYQCTGTVGTTPASMLTYLNAGAILDEQACPRDGYRHCIMTPATNAASVNALATLFHAGTKIDEQYRKGLMVDAFDMLMSMSQSINTHTFGTAYGTGTAAVGGMAADFTDGTATLNVDTLYTGLSFKKGDIVQIADCYSVNPETRTSTGRLMQFVVTADYDQTTTTAPALPIAPTPYRSGPLMNCWVSPAGTTSVSGKAVTIGGAIKGSGNVASSLSPQNLVFHRDAFVFATADLELPPGGSDIASRQQYDGISMRLWRQGDINSDQIPCRLDVLFGYKCVRPELAVRLAS